MGWLNSDGLYVKFGTDRTVPTKAGEYMMTGARRMVELVVDWEDTPVYTSTGAVWSDVVKIPSGVQIEEVTIETIEDWDSAADAMTMDVGLVRSDRSTEADFNGFVVAATQTELNTGGSNVAGWVGAYVGTVLGTTGAPFYLWVNVDTATATAGTSVVRIYYSVPPKVDDTLDQ